jgi:ATP-binding cassette subfamily C (CFTR/MRP) protein 1
MFAGTVRSNLDPFQQHGDEDLWQALEVANLHESVKALPGGLNAEVQENGRNFSLGQRQLLCLSRAFLRKSSVLVLDEATASLDQDTDHFIQQTLRRAFAQCTIITIAHRLHSIIDSDRILAMATGRVVEFDKPTTLLEQPNSFFSKLVDQAGDQRDVLRSMVFEHARKKLPVPK